MFLSWFVAAAYSLIYIVAILITRYKATQRLHRHKSHRRSRSSMRNGLIAHQQNMTPNETRIDELTTTDPPTAPPVATHKAGNSGSIRRNHGHQNSESVDLGTLHQQIHTSVPYGAPISDYECFIAMLHSVDAGIYSIFFRSRCALFRYFFSLFFRIDFQLIFC